MPGRVQAALSAPNLVEAQHTHLTATADVKLANSTLIRLLRTTGRVCPDNSSAAMMAYPRAWRDHPDRGDGARYRRAERSHW